MRGRNPPADADGGNPCILPCFHIHTGVACVNGFGSVGLDFFHDFKNNLRMGLGGYSLSLSEYFREVDFRKKLMHQLACRFVIFIGGNRQLHALLLQGPQQFGNTWIGTA